MRVLVMTGILLGVLACGAEEPAEAGAGTGEAAVTGAASGPDGAAAVDAEAAGQDSADVVATVEAFHRALAEADTATVRRLLAEDVVVLETGGVEDREEYLGHHLGADMAFAAAVPGPRDVIRVEVRGPLAWLASTSHRQGTFREREIDSRGAELVVLRRSAEGWRIASVHWSSR